MAESRVTVIPYLITDYGPGYPLPPICEFVAQLRIQRLYASEAVAQTIANEGGSTADAYVALGLALP